MWVGFLLAAYSVIANDSVQTLGTWIASNSERFKWQHLWDNPHLNPPNWKHLTDDSCFFPEIITSAMAHLS